MHISEGVLNAPILATCGAISLGLVAYGFYTLKPAQIPKIAFVSAVFFTASFVHIPLGPSSIHLILSGLAGAMLGFEAVLAIFVGLVLQAVFFGYGGVSVLGVNTLIIALPAVLARFIFLSFYDLLSKILRNFGLFLCGFMPILVSSVLLSLVLVLNGDEFKNFAYVLFAYNAVLALIEGIISLFVLNFILKAKKEILL